MNFLRFNFLFAAFLFWGTGCFAGAPTALSSTAEIIRVVPVSILEDPADKLTFSDVTASREFKESGQPVSNLGISNSSFWLRFEISNTTNTDELLLKLGYPTLDQVVLYTPRPDGSYQMEEMGEHKPFYTRMYNHPSYIFNIHVPSGQTRTCYIKIRSGGQILAPLSVGTTKAVLDSIRTENLLFGLYCGIILVMFFYNLFIYFTVRDKIYLYYVGYILVVGLVQACLQGYTFQFLWPESPWLAIHSIYLLSALVGIATIQFVKTFLHSKEYTPGLCKGLYIFNAIYFAYIVLDLFNLSYRFYNVIQVCALLVSLYLLYMGFRTYRKNYRPAKYFLVAWFVFLTGVFLFAIKDLGILPYNNFTIYTMPAGSAIETILLSFALADRINIFKKEKEESQAREFAALQENERIIREQNIILEAKVRERTEELQVSNKELSIALKNLKETQIQLVDAEKMASLGQLTAGIAHEINNPINFVISNVKPLKRDIEDIISLIDKYEEIKSGGNVDIKLKEIERYKEELDLHYLMQEINSLLKGIDEGANRTSEIVKGLRNFSRLDENDIKKINIHEGLNSTLTVLNNQLRDRITVIKNYGELPMIDCYPGKLNQVFMNILNNAIQAIDAQKLPPMEGKIVISTTDADNNVEIRIKDNGVGIPESNRHKIFEPFFTTKNVGEGTGLGLSIAYTIIEKHNGRISVESEKGVGTEFIIILPKTIVA